MSASSRHSSHARSGLSTRAGGGGKAEKEEEDEDEEEDEEDAAAVPAAFPLMWMSKSSRKMRQSRSVMSSRRLRWSGGKSAGSGGADGVGSQRPSRELAGNARAVARS